MIYVNKTAEPWGLAAQFTVNCKYFKFVENAYPETPCFLHLGTPKVESNGNNLVNGAQKEGHIYASPHLKVCILSYRECRGA